MARNEFELHPNRLATTDAHGRRVFLFPADVAGRFRRYRTRVQFALIVFFLALPWMTVGGRQALLFDVVQRRFEIFGLSLRAHNAPLLFLVLATAAFGLFFATTLYGRVWCGWACPQTVFIDGVFRRIERWVEGPALERRALAAAPLTFHKLRKRSLKWSLYLLASFVVTHSFYAYFVGTDRLYEMMTRSPLENVPSFLFMLGLNAVILFDFVWFREQFCTIVCPYGRFQSVLMDRSSLAVTYDVTRGEPRATPQVKQLSKMHGSKMGDCVNCYRCVQVCPTGIDIRRGLQMECIACTSCIDACDAVMTKIGKPTGLIRYDSAGGKRFGRRRFSARAAIYLVFSLASAAALAGVLASLEPVSVQVLRAKGSPYSIQEVGGQTIIINHLKLEISNQSGADAEVDLEFEEALPGLSVILGQRPVFIENGRVAHVDAFVRFPKSILKNGILRREMVVHIKNKVTGEIVDVEREATLVGPF